jgi:hypothetical protein
MDHLTEASRFKRRRWLAYAITVGPLLALLTYKFGPEWKGCGWWLAHIWMQRLCTLPRPVQGGVIDFISNALGEGLTVVVVIDLLLRYRERQHMLEVIQASLQATLQLIFSGDTPEIFGQLSDQQRARIVRGSLVSTLGKEYGDGFYDQMVAAYLKRDVSYRKGFVYNIRCYESIPRPISKIFTTHINYDFFENISDEHLWVRQTVAYERCGSHKTKPLPKLFARFALNRKQLNTFIADDTLFFRELLRVSPSVRRYIQDLDDRGMDALVRNVMQLRISEISSGREIDYQVLQKRDADQCAFFEVEFHNPTGVLERAGCSMDFSLPHLRADKEFLVTLPQPVEPVAEVSFTKSALMKDLSYIPFISNFNSDTFKEEVIAQNKQIETIKIKIKGWAFPTGGLVFVWS